MLCSPRGFAVQLHQVSGSIMWSLSSASRNPISKCSQRNLTLPTSYTTGHSSAVSSVHKHKEHYSTQTPPKAWEWSSVSSINKQPLHNSLNIAFMRGNNSQRRLREVHPKVRRRKWKPHIGGENLRSGFKQGESIMLDCDGKTNEAKTVQHNRVTTASNGNPSNALTSPA